MTMVAVGFGSTQSIEALELFRQNNGGTNWQMATAPSTMAVDFRVFTQSTKLIMDADGVVLYRAGYGSTGADSWRQVLDAVLQ